MISRTVVASGAMLCAWLVFASVAQADQIFVGVRGGLAGDFFSEVANAPRHFEAREFTMPVAVPVDASTGTVRSVMRQYAPIKITKLAGPASVQLYRALVTNEVLQDVTIDFVRVDEEDRANRIFQSVRLTDARVVGFERKLSADAKGQKQSVDEVAFTFRQIEVTSTEHGLTVTDQLGTVR